MNTRIKHIIEQLIEVQEGRPWMGSSFERKLKRIDKDLVFTRPIEGLHSIAEIMSHITFWRKESILKIQTGKGSKTDDSPENWLSNDQLKPLGWEFIKSEYDKTLSKLVHLLKTKDDTFLDEDYYDPDFKGHYPYSFMINGILHHDIYHLGQLGIIVKYLKKDPSANT